MQNFIIEPNEYLGQKIQAFYHADYTGYGTQGNPNYINDLKNTFNNYSKEKLDNAIEQLHSVLKKDLSEFDRSLTICIVPRSKAENTYRHNQLLFKKVVQHLINDLGFQNGSDYIIRNTNTKTTHLQRAIEEDRIFNYDNSGDLPYPGITRKTCVISNEVKGKDILLIDDLYTKNINIDEDAIQALFDKGANSVVFYAVGKTVE